MRALLLLSGLALAAPAWAQVSDLGLPPFAATTVDTPLMLSRATFDAPRVEGAPAEGEALRLAVSAGEVLLGDGAVVIVERPDPTTVVFTGPGVADALDGLVVVPPPGFTGAVELTLELLGPAPQSARLTVPINATLDADGARDALLAGVATLHGGVQPGHMVAHGAQTADIAFYPGGPVSGPMVTAARWGAGRVVALGDHQALNMHVYGGPDGGDSGRFYHNALTWLAGADGRQAAVVTTDAAVAGWLGDQGYADVRLAALVDLQAALADADVFVPPWLGTRVPDAAYAVIGAFVRRGGGLLICEYGVGWDWWWGRPKSEAPGNVLLRQAGIAFAGGNRGEVGTLAPERAAGRMSADDLLAVLADPAGVDAARRDRAGAVLGRIFDGLDPADPLTLRLDAALGQAFAAVSPTPATPVADPWDKALLTREYARLRALPPDGITAHRTAEALYGAVPDAAARLQRAVAIDPAVTRWHATGLYAPPGEVIELRAPPEIVERGLVLRINGHTDDMAPRDTWLRPPRVHWSAPVDAAVVRLASPYGGAIYVDVGADAGDLAPFEVTVSGGVEQPWFVLGRDTDVDWMAAREAPGPYAELQSPRLSISLPSSMIRDLDRPEALMAFWDRVIEAQDAIGGHAERRTTGERINIDVQVAYGYLHAGYPTQGPLVAGPELADVDALARQGSWGWFHEMGHEAQRRPDKSWGYDNPYTFDGSVEATVNIFTAYAMSALGLRAEGGWGWTNDRIGTMRRALEGLGQGTYADVGVGYKLAMFLQLRDGFGWDAIGATLATYQDGPLPAGEQAERDAWLVRASQATGHDLGRFMGDVWGIPLGDDARATVADLPDWLPALGVVTGPLTVTAGAPRAIDVGGTALSHDGVARVDLEAPPAHGRLEGPVAGVFTYVADGGYTGPDAFAYGVTSSTGHRAIETVTLDVRDTGVTLELWWNIAGTAVDALRADPRFPDAPDEVRHLAGPVMTPGQGDAYGARMRGFVVPPADGDYVFWIASDDNGELWLSRDHTPDGLARIARVPDWTGAEQWDRFAEQRSAPIALEGGRAYAFEALMKEGGGGDHLAVAWAADGPDARPAIIAGEALRPWRAVNGAPRFEGPRAAAVPPDLDARLEVSTSDPDGDRVHVISAVADRGRVTVDGAALVYAPPPGYEGPGRIDVIIGDGHGGEAAGAIELTVFEWLRVTDPAPTGGWIGGCADFTWAPVPDGAADGYTLRVEQAGEVRRIPADARGARAVCALPDGPLRWSVEAVDAATGRRFVSPGGAVTVDGTPPGLDDATVDLPRRPFCPGDGFTVAWAPARDLGVGLAETPYTFTVDIPGVAAAQVAEPSVEWGAPLPDGQWSWRLEAVDRLGNSATVEGAFTIDCTPPTVPASWSGIVHGAHVVDAPLDTGLVWARPVRLWMDGSLCFTADRACDPPPTPAACAGPLGPDPRDPVGESAIVDAPFGALLVESGDGWQAPQAVDARGHHTAGGGGGGRLAVNSAAASGCRAPGYAVSIVDGAGPATLRPVAGQVVADARPTLLYVGAAEPGPAGDARVGVWLDGVWRGAVAGADAQTLALDVDLPEGEHTWHVTVADAAGNTARSAASTFVVDLSPPDAPEITAPADPSPRPDGSFEVCWRRSDDVGGVDHYRVEADGLVLAVVEQTPEGVDPCGSITLPPAVDCFSIEAFDRVGYTARASRCFDRPPAPDGGLDGGVDGGAADMASDDSDMASDDSDMASDDSDMASDDSDMAPEGTPDGGRPGAEPAPSSPGSDGCGATPASTPTPWGPWLAALWLVGLVTLARRRAR